MEWIGHLCLEAGALTGNVLATIVVKASLSRSSPVTTRFLLVNLQAQTGPSGKPTLGSRSPEVRGSSMPFQVEYFYSFGDLFLMNCFCEIRYLLISTDIEQPD